MAMLNNQRVTMKIGDGCLIFSDNDSKWNIQPVWICYEYLPTFNGLDLDILQGTPDISEENPWFPV